LFFLLQVLQVLLLLLSFSFFRSVHWVHRFLGKTGVKHKVERGEKEKEKKKKKNERVHWVTMDSRVEMAFFTSSTLPGVNLNMGETDAWVGNWCFSRVSFLACT